MFHANPRGDVPRHCGEDDGPGVTFLPPYWGNGYTGSRSTVVTGTRVLHPAVRLTHSRRFSQLLEATDTCARGWHTGPTPVRVQGDQCTRAPVDGTRCPCVCTHARHRRVHAHIVLTTGTRRDGDGGGCGDASLTACVCALCGACAGCVSLLRDGFPFPRGTPRCRCAVNVLDGACTGCGARPRSVVRWSGGRGGGNVQTSAVSAGDVVVRGPVASCVHVHDGGRVLFDGVPWCAVPGRLCPFRGCSDVVCAAVGAVHGCVVSDRTRLYGVPCRATLCAPCL